MVIAKKEISGDLANLLAHLTKLCQKHYGEKLVSLAVFGSVGRGTARPESDLDFLLVVNELPVGRIARVKDFASIETALGSIAKAHLDLSPIFKTPKELLSGSLLLLDMTEDALILFDRDDFFKLVIKDLKERLKRLGAHRIWQGNTWYWDLKPDYKTGEVFEI
jgi:uncharacterized protein